MPMPMVLPTMTARPKPTPRIRIRPDLEGGMAVAAVSPEWWAIDWRVLTARCRPFQRDEPDIDGAAEVSRRMARADLFELHVAALPAGAPSLALRRGFHLAPRPWSRPLVWSLRM